MTDVARFERELADVVAAGGREGPRRIIELCVAQLPVSGAGITLMSTPDRQQPLWASDDVAAQIDELQFRLGEGPCVDAFSTQRVVLVADVADVADDRWPLFAPAARETSARALVVLPLRGENARIGVLDFYSDRPGLPDAVDLAAARRAADATFWALLDLRRRHTLDDRGAPAAAEEDPAGWLRDSPLEHTDVYQATGMLIVQLDVSADSALARLRAYAFVHERPIAEVARDVVARRLRFSEEDE